MPSTFAVCLFFVMLLIAQGSNLVEKRCNSPEHKDCTFLSQYMQVWCDSTNLTRIPSPNQLPPSHVSHTLANAIYMNKSCLRDINADALREYTCLSELDFDGNLLTNVPASSFSTCRKLGTLKLSNNSIATVEPRAFAELRKLVDLRLNHNRIETLHPDTFKDLDQLETLTLNDNRLVVIRKKLFLNLVKLDRLDLSRNRLKKLTKWDLRGLPQLRILNLEGNNLLKIESEAFLSTPKLIEVNLDNNNLSCLPHDVFKLLELSHVTFAGNKLQTPKPDWVRSLARHSHQLSSINRESITAGNRWRCDCQVIPYQRFLLEEMGDLEAHVERFDVVCNEPEAFQGRSLRTLTLDDIDRHYNGTCNKLTTKYKDCDAKEATREAKIDPKQLTTSTTTATIRSAATTAHNVGVREELIQDKNPQNNNMYLIIGGVAVVILVILALVLARFYNQNRRLKATLSARGSQSNRTESTSSSFDSDIRSQYDQVPYDGHGPAPTNVILSHRSNSAPVSPTHVTVLPHFTPCLAQNQSGIALIVPPALGGEQIQQQYAELDHSAYDRHENVYNEEEVSTAGAHHYHTIPYSMPERYFNVSSDYLTPMGDNNNNNGQTPHIGSSDG